MKYKVADYKEPQYYTPKTELLFDIASAKTLVTAKYKVVSNHKLDNNNLPDVELNGHQKIQVLSLKINNQQLTAGKDYTISKDGDYTLLRLANNFGVTFELEQQVAISPDENLSYEGLYTSDGGLVTQNESQGFRRIVYSIDRPDNLSIFTTTIIGDKKQFPVMLSNGNEVTVDIEVIDGKHVKAFHDPFPKPSYLFALCCGDYSLTDLLYDTNPSHANKKLELYAPRFERQENVTFALDVLYRMMRWNEQKYNIELDLDEYRVVGVTKFNSGAMENKGLNVFSSSDVFLNPKFSTDHNYKRVLTVVSHEAAHNWAGNRVTVRDWSQLCLKEGLATHIEQQFSRDVLASPVIRLENIEILRNRQFAEDASYLAHPVHPKEYDSIDNFYTLTIYEKGAELLQTLEELLGEDTFTAGVNSYFKKFDSYNYIESDYFEKGPTIEQFIQALAGHSGTDLSQFMNWYDYAGTPELSFTDSYDDEKQEYHLTIEQYSPPTSKQPEQRPAFLIPIKVALLARDGSKFNLIANSTSVDKTRDVGIDHQGNRYKKVNQGHANQISDTEVILQLTDNKQTFVFSNIHSKPIPSLLRNFTAPVKIKYDPLTIEDNQLLIAHDDDAFVKWDRMQLLFTNEIVAIYNNSNKEEQVNLNDSFKQLYITILEDNSISHDLKAMLLALPSYGYIAQIVDTLDPIKLHKILKQVKTCLATAGYDLLITLRDNLYQDETLDNLFDIDNTGPVKDRMLFLRVQDLLCYSKEKENRDFALNTAKEKSNFTLVYDSYISYLSASEQDISIIGNDIISKFYELSKDDINFKQKWLSMQASIATPDCIDNIEKLISGEIKGFDLEHPHQSYSLIRHFMLNNQYFHDKSGRGYKVIANALYKIDTEIKNHNISSRLAAVFLPAKNLSSEYKTKVLAEIDYLKSQTNISESLSEIVNSA